MVRAKTDTSCNGMEGSAERARYGSIIVSSERVSGFVEKGESGPGLINAGIYIVQPNVF